MLEHSKIFWTSNDFFYQNEIDNRIELHSNSSKITYSLRHASWNLQAALVSNFRPRLRLAFEGMAWGACGLAGKSGGSISTYLTTRLSLYLHDIMMNIHQFVYLSSLNPLEPYEPLWNPMSPHDLCKALRPLFLDPYGALWINKGSTGLSLTKKAFSHLFYS